MNYKQAQDQGYYIYRTAWQKKYISRKININDQPVLIAGGNCKGELYIEGPCWISTQYSFRHYLKK